MRNYGKVEKGWGHEEIWASNDKYCGKIMHFNNGAKFSMHFHAQKDETWYVLEGIFQVETINTKDSFIKSQLLYAGDTWHNPPLVPHRLTAIKAGRILEVSTPDSIEDNYRVMPGDSQSPVEEKFVYPEIKEPING